MTMQRTAIASPHPRLNTTDPAQVPRSAAMRAGNLLFLSEVTAVDPNTGSFKAGSVTEQTRIALQNVADLLAAAGTAMAHAVKVTIHLASILDYEEMNAVYVEFFTGDSLPARTVCAVQMAGGQKVAIECIAAIPA